MLTTTIASSAEFVPFSKAAKAAAFAEMDRYTAGLRKLAPDMGAYMNEVGIPGGWLMALSSIPLNLDKKLTMDFL